MAILRCKYVVVDEVTWQTLYSNELRKPSASVEVDTVVSECVVHASSIFSASGWSQTRQRVGILRSMKHLVEIIAASC